MIRNSIYRCYGIIPTIKEVFHLPNDLRLASQDTENDLLAMSFAAQRARSNVCVCVFVGLVTPYTASSESHQPVGFGLLPGESGGI